MGRLLFAVVLVAFGWIGWEGVRTRRRAAERVAAVAEAAEARRRDSAAARDAYRALRKATGGGRRRAYGSGPETPTWVQRIQARHLTTPNAAPRRDLAADKARVERYAAYTYIEAIAAGNEGELARWPARTQPLRMWVQGNPGIPGWTAEHRSVARGALGTWDAAQLPFRIVATDDSTEADVFVLWTRDFGGMSMRIGETSWLRDEHGWIIAATIHVAVGDGRGQPLDIYTVQNVARHEIGHAIGLDHSPDPADIMAPSEGGQSRLSERDVNTARLLYALSPGRYPGTARMSAAPREDMGRPGFPPRRGR